MFFNQLSCKTMNIKWNRSKMEFYFLEIEIWCAWLGLYKNYVLIMQYKKCQLYSILYKIL